MPHVLSTMSADLTAAMGDDPEEGTRPWPDPAIPRIGPFLVELERLERAQVPGRFLVDRFEATPHGVVLRLRHGGEVLLPVDAAAAVIGEALRTSIPDLRIPIVGKDPGFSDEPDVWTQWAQLHYALGAYDTAVLAGAHVLVLAAERHGRSATVQILRGTDDTAETYSIGLDRAIDIGLADTLAFAPAYGLVGGSLDAD